MLKTILTVFLLLMALPAWATTYYVGTTGSDSNPGTSGSRFLTINKCVVSMTTPGDTCLVGNGTYQGSGSTTVAICASGCSAGNAANGTQASPITLKSENYLGATIRLPSGASGQRGVLVSGRTDWVIEGFDIQGGTGTTAANHGISLEGGSTNRIVIRRNSIHNIARTVCSDSTSGNTGILVNGPSLNVTIENNLFYAIGRLRNGESGCSTTSYQHDHGIYSISSTNMIIRRNIIYDTNRGWPLHFYGGTNTSLNVYNNTIHGHCLGPGTCPSGGHIMISGIWAGSSNIKNNIFSDPTTAPFSRTTNPSGSGTITISYNLTDRDDADWFDGTNGGAPSQVVGTDCTPSCIQNTSPGFVAVGSNDFRLAAASAAIDVGVAISGMAYNGSVPDMGAYETFGFTSAGITGNTLDVQLGMNLNIPVLPATGQTTWTVGCTGTGCGTRTVTAAAKKSGTDSVVSLTVDGAACTDVQTWTVTYAVGTVTDSALIGGTLTQRLNAFSGQTVVNNCGAPAATGTLSQVTHQFTQSQTPGNPLGTVGVASTDIRPGTSFALVTQIDCTVAACDSIGLRLYYRKNAGAYAAVPDTMGADQIAFLGTTSDPAYLSGPVTCCLSGALTPNTGTTGFTSAAVPVFTLTQNSSIVQRRQLIIGTSAVATDTYEFKEYNQTGVVLNGTYTPANGAKLTVSAATLDAPTGLHLASQAGANVGLVWTPSTDSALLGYRLYQSATSGVQGTLVATMTPALAAATHTPITTWHGHPTPGTWYYLITQFDTGGQESPIPPELTVVVPAAIARTARTP